MTFVTTGLAIAGLAAVAIPILVHLLSRQRRRPIQWAAMRFLLEALRKHRRRLQLEQMLLLAVRCLILALLGAALARPFLEAAGMLDSSGSRVVYLVVDNGLASGAKTMHDGEQRTALDGSIGTAVSLVESLGAGDAVGVITAARPATGLVVPPSSDLRAVIELLRSLEPQQSPTDFHAALPLLKSALDDLGPRADHAVAYLLSDFRSGSAPLDATLPGDFVGTTAARLLAAPVSSEAVANTQVVSLEPLRGLILSEGEDGTGQVTVRLARSGGDLTRDVTRVRLVGDGLPPIEPRVIDWAPGQARGEVDFNVNLAGRGDGTVSLSAVIDDDALGPDNARHTVLLSRGRVRALLVDRRSFGADRDLDHLRAGPWLARALQPSERSPIDVIEVDPAALDAVDVRGADVAMVVRPDLLNDEGWTVLDGFIRTGGLVLITPPGESNVHPWTDRLSETLGLPWRIDLEVTEFDPPMLLSTEQPASELLRLISGDLEELAKPVIVSRMLAVDTTQTIAETVLALEDGSPLVIAGSPQEPDSAEAATAGGSGLVVYLAVSPELSWTNLPAQPLMVPLVHELVKQGIGVIRTTRRYDVGEKPALGLGSVASALIGPDGKTISIDTAGRPAAPLDRAGLYGVYDHGRQRVGSIAVNVDPAAGRTDPQDQAVVNEWLGRSGPWEIFDAGNAAAALRTADSGAPLAGILLAVVLGLIVLETALARWFSHALPPARRAGAAGNDEMAEAAAIAPHG